MASFELNLPLDIPWRRIAVTRDMIDSTAGDRQFPLRWQSSISVFDYQPDEEYQNHEGMIVSYLKVSCSITGFQPRGDEVGLHHSAARVGATSLEDGDYLIDPSRWNDSSVIKAYKHAIDDYYGCYGAVLEVTVTPKTDRENVLHENYPYFADFEPKKRELYEIVSETGEVMSRSHSGLNVRKGSTTTDSHEVLDIFGGANAEVSVGDKGGGGVGVQGQWGTRDLNQTEYVDMRSTDSAREKRESFSHSTQLSQMYHQLNSYHIGTNRALFYILPRPHIVQLSSDDPEEADRSTFVDGPRLLEGIQDFFLVVLRPEDVEDICVEAYLETAHIYQEKIPVHPLADHMVDEFEVNGSLNHREGETERADDEESAHEFVNRVAESALGGAIGATIGAPLGPLASALGTALGALYSWGFGDELDETTLTAITRTFSPSETALEFDLTRADLATAYPIGSRKQYLGCELLGGSLSAEQVSVVGMVYSQKFTKKLVFNIGSRKELGKARIRVEVPQRQKEPVLINGEKALFLTGRGVSTCRAADDPGFDKPTVDWEKPLPQPWGGKDPGLVSDKDPGLWPGKMTRSQANEIGADIRRQLLASVTSSDRPPRGQVSFAESDFFARHIGKIVETSHSDRIAVQGLTGLGRSLLAKLEKSGRGVMRSDILEFDRGRIAATLGLDASEVLSLRRAALGLVSPKVAARMKPAPARPETVEVPDLTALTLAEVERALERQGLERGAKRMVDDERPTGHVVAQDPKPGVQLAIGGRVDVTLSSGCAVRIPDIVGEPLQTALARLKRAGLARLPDIGEMPVDDESRHGIVLHVQPEARNFVLPNALVALAVGSRRKPVASR